MEGDEDEGKLSPCENGKANANNGGSGGDQGEVEAVDDRERNASENETNSISTSEHVKKKQYLEGGGAAAAVAAAAARSVASHESTKSESAQDTNAAETRKSQRRLTSISGNGESHSDDEVDVPVKEIHMTKKEREEEERVRKLDSTTLSVLREALSGGAPQIHLNDDELLHFMARVDREARQQSHLQGGSHPEESDGSVLEELVAETEDLALGREVLHKAISAVNRKYIGEIDRRTVEWVKRASGMGRSKMENFIRENTEAGRINKGSVGRGRYTRNMARSTREERREKGLGILVSAVDELEDTLGPYPIYKPKKRKRPPPEKEPELQPEETQQKAARTSSRKKITDNKRKNDKNDIKAHSKTSKEPLRDNGYRHELVEQIPEPSLQWEDVRHANENDVELFDFPACKKDNSVYARKSMRLVRRMRQEVLSWSRYEFFYSDVDRAWYGYKSVS